MKQDLNIELAVKVMGWRLAPNRYLTGDGGWKAYSRFRPTEHISDSFALLDGARAQEIVITAEGNLWIVRVRIGNGVGEARHRSCPLAISRAVAAAAGIVPESTTSN